jgi:NADH-quinone oxidoreductase subunit F
MNDNNSKLTSIKELEAKRAQIIADRPDVATISVCCGTGCQAFGGQKIAKAFMDSIASHNLQESVAVKTTGCHGFCERGLLVVIRPQNILYQHVELEDVEEIMNETILKGNVIERLLYITSDGTTRITAEEDVPFYKKQQRLVFGANGYIDPTEIDDYIAIGGYSALAKALSSMEPEQVIDEIDRAGLRGRGGGGFPTAKKWKSTREAYGEVKYVICNCDEGDPGAFMDRSLMEGNPHSIIEGMIIGAYAAAANSGIVYIRNEYPLAVKNTEIAIRQAQKYGLLGDDILGSGFNFNIVISRGGGAFVCGESTALMASIEGKVGEPRAKYVHTSEKGLYDRPTVLNNVETWANVPLIINRGASWYSSIGTEHSKGTKIFSLVGKINHTGLVEVPMGITLREIIYEIGGGIPDNKKFKAVLTGGPSGGCIPESLLDLPVDFDELTRVGSMMGSGAMIVLDENNCVVDIARYFLKFLEEESCGKCVPCREGLERMRQILDDISEGKGTESHLGILEEMSESIKVGSLCGLGQTAPNPVMTTLKYFREEYLAHIVDKKCPAGVCKSLVTYNIVDENCTACRICVKNCPAGAIEFIAKKTPVVLHQEMCTKCGACMDVCKFDAVEIR